MPLTISYKGSVIGIGYGPKYASVVNVTNILKKAHARAYYNLSRMM